MTATAETHERHGVVGPLLRLALPVLAEQLLYMLVGLSDTFMAGQYLETPHLAAMNLMNYLLWLLTSLTGFVGIGATAMIARFMGANDAAMARRVLHQSLLLAAALGLLLTTLLALLGPALVRVMQLEPPADALAIRYIGYLVPVVPLMMFDSIGIACLRGAGDMVTGLASMTLVNLVNTSLSFGLLVGLGPLPRLGWDGLAIGTATGHVVGGLFILAMLARGRRGLKLSWPLFRFDRDLCRRVLKIGTPGGCDALFVVTCHLTYVSMINSLGELAAAAHGVAVRVESFSYLPGTAFQLAATTLVGQYLGARQLRRARHSVWTSCLWGGGLMSLAALGFGLGATQFAGIFIRREEGALIAQTARLLRIVALATPSLALTMILHGALRGAGDTRWPLAINLFGLALVRLPAAWLLSHTLGYGVEGAYWAMVTDLGVRSLAASYRFRHGGWHEIEV